MRAPALARHLAQQLRWQDVDPALARTLIDLARREDLEGWGLRHPPRQREDVTSSVLEHASQSATARLVAREPMVVCGLPLVPLVLEAYGTGAAFTPAVDDGTWVDSGAVIGSLTGPSGVLLPAERVLLNFLQKLSGVATLTRQYVQALGESSTRLLDTRKTTPGFRVLEKYATACGGGFNHRIGLFDRVMLKDNHLAADKASAGEALAALVRKARQRWPELIIELEVDTLEQIPPALDAGVDVLLLDNFSVPELCSAIKTISHQAVTEASGGVTLETLPALAELGLDFISTGATIHHATWMDIGLDWEEAAR